MQPESPRVLRFTLAGLFLVGFAGLFALVSGAVQSRLLCVLVGLAWVLLVPLYPALALANGYSPTRSGGVDYRAKSPFAFWAGLATYTALFSLAAVAVVVYAAAKYNELPH